MSWQPGGTIVEATSGNTGIALAMVGAARGYKVVLAMPETMSKERRALLRAYGAELVLTPGSEGMKGAVARAEQIVAEREGAVLARQFANEANPEIHRRTTAEEIWKDTDGAVDIVVAGIGTGGTITGVGQVLKAPQARRPDRSPSSPRSPRSSTAASPGRTRSRASAPTSSRRSSTPTIYDEVIDVNAATSVEWARRAATEEGLLVGISSGPRSRPRPRSPRARRTPARRSSSSSRASASATSRRSCSRVSSTDMGRSSVPPGRGSARTSTPRCCATPQQRRGSTSP